jgi:hypothetical protein
MHNNIQGMSLNTFLLLVENNTSSKKQCNKKEVRDKGSKLYLDKLSC